MKLKYFYRIDNQGKPILGSNIRRKSKPFAGKWKELFNKCCDPQTIPCTCGFRYFVQLDHKNNPVDYTLIKRAVKPRPEEGGVKLMEVSWEDPCCS